MIAAIVQVNGQAPVVIVSQVQGPTGSSTPTGYSSVTKLSGSGAKVVAAPTGRNLILVSAMTGPMTIQLPNGPTNGSSWVIKVMDTSLSVAHTLQVLGNGFHVEWDGSNDAGGANTGPVFTPANFGAIGGQSAEWVADTADSTWVSV